MSNPPIRNLWSTAEHALDYLGRADKLPHRTEGERTLLEFVPANAARILDLGSGDGRLMGLAKADRPQTQFVALDFSRTMLDALQRRFAGDPTVTVVEHDMSNPLPPLGEFDAIISCLAIHHLTHERKRALYAEAFAALRPGGLFCNLEHVTSPTENLHQQFVERFTSHTSGEDPSNQLLDLETQLQFLREIGFEDVDCHWKWRELALFGGVKSRG